jgi:hypothetical protein
MRRLNSTEIGALILAAFLVIGGIISAAVPREGFVGHQSYRFVPSYIEYVSKGKARAYGLIAVLVGLCLGSVVFYRRR